MVLGDEIRQFICEKYIEPARKRGQSHITIVSGEVHTFMALESRMPAVCGALRSKVLEEKCRIQLINEIRKPGVKKDSSTNKFLYKIY